MGQGHPNPHCASVGRAVAQKRAMAYSRHSIGTLFLAKAPLLRKPGGYIAMLQPIGALLLNARGPATQFRKRLFTSYAVEEITNLSALRFELFAKAVGPACVVIIRCEEPDGAPLTYYSQNRLLAVTKTST